MRCTMIALLVVVAWASACGKGGENAACSVDADCEDGLRCALLQGGDGATREMCVDRNGAWDMAGTEKPHGLRRYAVPAGVVGGVILVLLVMLRASVRARVKRKRAAADPPPRG